MAGAANGNDLVQQVRAGDYDRFLAIQLARPAQRAALYTLTNFHNEIARIAETVSEPLIGHIRLAWWREGLEEIMAGKPPRNHPLMQALATLDARTYPHLRTMLEARAVDMDTSLIALETAWLDYCDNTAGALHSAWAIILNADAAHLETIRRQARGYAMVGLVRAIPFMMQQGWLRFPHARMNNIDLVTLEPSETLNRFCKTILDEALALLTKNPSLPKPLRALTALAQLHARQLAREGHDPYRQQPQKLAAAWTVIIITAN
ncbi:MAG: phytoene/squalene synthase family protein [Rickettsiales bacterium]